MPKKGKGIPVVLTPENYFSKENRYLSNSKLSDYFKDPYYFYQKHILHRITEKKSDAFTLGSAIDCYLTEGKDVFLSRYVCVARKSKEPAPGVIELTNAVYEQALLMSEAVARQPAYKEIIKHKYKARQIFAIKMNVGPYFEGICGRPDWYCIYPNKLCVIRDLKTTQSIDPNRYYYSCLDYGYFRQQAFYQMLIKQTYPELDLRFKSQHIAVEKDPDGIHHVATFTLSQRIIEEEKKRLNTIFVDLSRDREKWKPQYISWGMAKHLPENDVEKMEELFPESPAPVTESIEKIVGALS